MLRFGKDRLARLDYRSGSFRVLSQGDHVLCAVTGHKIMLNDLRYWSHELQEAYVDAVTANRRYAEARAEGTL
ncbi:MAG: DUF2093 domain-containing protein [Pacificimonas sp.]|jgi:hypothetical protein|nr:DUF2093 domain-containing protein [Pacificimonas sp.]